MSAAQTRDWRRPLEAKPRDYFKPGMAVRHLNPELADWKGFVDIAPSGRYKGRWARIHPTFGDPCVYVRWVEGTRDDGTHPGIGWMDAEAVDRVDGAR